jgi:hypothetical protein
VLLVTGREGKAAGVPVGPGAVSVAETLDEVAAAEHAMAGRR